MALDLQVSHAESTTDPAAFPLGAPPVCTLSLGVLSGMVTLDGVPVSDGTFVEATMGGGLAQRVVTAAGRYMVTTVGTRCGSGPEQFLDAALAVAGSTIVLTPGSAVTVNDIALSSQDLSISSATCERPHPVP